MKVKKEVIIFIIVSILLFTLLPLAESKEVSTLATVEVKPAYNLSIDIDIFNNKLSSGENLNVSIELRKIDLINISEEISVDLNYEITKKGKKSKTIESGFLKTVNITDNRAEVIEILISSDLKGKHILKIIASNPQSHSDEDSETFVVRKKTTSRFPASFSFQGLTNLLYHFQKN